MVRSFVAAAAIVVSATSTAVPGEGHAFANLPVGGVLRNRSLPTADGKRLPLLGTNRANLFVFFRPGQDHSLQTLGQLARLEKEFAGKSVRFVAVTSDSYPREEVAATAREAGIAMPILVDAGDALYGELGVALHPVVGITDERGKLVAYQHFLKINMLDVVRGRIQVALGEIGEAEMARLVEPPAATVELGNRSGAKSRFLLARALLGRGSVEKAIENARAGVALDPSFAPVHAILAKALAAAGQCAEAEREVAEALRLDAKDPTAAEVPGHCVASRSDGRAAAGGARGPRWGLRCDHDGCNGGSSHHSWSASLSRIHRLALRSSAIAAALALANTAGAQGGGVEPVRFWPSATCANCHVSQVEQHFQSHHEKSFTSPLFQAQYFEMVLPRAARDPSIAADARNCTACHSPVSFANTRGLATSAGVTDPSLSGVTCDLCHTIVGYEGSAPQNGNFVVSPGPIKYGPFKRESKNHSAYNELQTKSEVCAICHEAVNSHGVRVKATYSEWKQSAFAKQGVQCQDCHMSKDGVFVDGGRYESGKVSADALSRAPSRDKIYSHRFPGIHSGAAVEGALGLKLLETPASFTAGQPATLTLVVDNGNTAHCLPTGSADLRLLWLEVTARIGDRAITLPADNRARGTWAAVGENSDDALVIGGDVPVGSRLYRAVFFDRRNHQTLASFDATSIAFDNRLQPGERRREAYTFDVPRDAEGPVRIEARLRYRAFPTSLAKELDVTPPDVVEVARAVAEYAVAPAPPESRVAPAVQEHLTPMERLRKLKERNQP